jgi:acyl-CoA hydrolase
MRRTLKLVCIAHPDFQEELIRDAWRMKIWIKGSPG